MGIKKGTCWGVEVAQSVKHPTPDFSSCHDLTVRDFQPGIRLCADGVEPAWDSLSVHPPPKKVKIKKREREKENSVQGRRCLFSISFARPWSTEEVGRAGARERKASTSPHANRPLNWPNALSE